MSEVPRIGESTDSIVDLVQLKRDVATLANGVKLACGVLAGFLESMNSKAPFTEEQKRLIVDIAVLGAEAEAIQRRLTT